MDQLHESSRSQVIQPNEGDVSMMWHGHRVKNFSGAANQDAYTWMDNFERIAKTYRWKDADKINRLALYLDGAARDWLDANVDANDNWCQVKEKFLSVFLPRNYKDHIKGQLRRKFQMIGEPVTNYIHSKWALCKRVDAAMKEDDIIC